MPAFCPLCASDENTREESADDGRRFAVCTHRSHGEDGFVWEQAPQRRGSTRRDGLGAKLEIWDKLLECVPADGTPHSYGEVEDAFILRYPDEAAALQERYGHRWREGKRSPNSFSMSAYLAARLSELADESHLVKTFGPAEGPWAYNAVISHWARGQASTAQDGPAIFVPGEPVLSGGRGQDEWQDSIRARLSGPVDRPNLTFVVSNLRRKGHPFDLDNLVHPVLMVLDDPVDQVSARIHIGNTPGLLMEDRDADPPALEPLRQIYVETHSMTSDRDRAGIPQIQDDPVFDRHEGLGLALEFDGPDIPIRRGWFGPTEAVIDDLVPWLGTYTKRELIADHRIRDLRITRGVNPVGSGVAISLWYVPDSEIAVPPHLQTRIDALS